LRSILGQHGLQHHQQRLLPRLPRGACSRVEPLNVHFCTSLRLYKRVKKLIGGEALFCAYNPTPVGARTCYKCTHPCVRECSCTDPLASFPLASCPRCGPAVRSRPCCSGTSLPTSATPCFR
jgi:hypothetical protein